MFILDVRNVYVICNAVYMRAEHDNACLSMCGPLPMARAAVYLASRWRPVLVEHFVVNMYQHYTVTSTYQNIYSIDIAIKYCITRTRIHCNSATDSVPEF